MLWEFMMNAERPGNVYPDSLRWSFTTSSTGKRCNNGKYWNHLSLNIQSRTRHQSCFAIDQTIQLAQLRGVRKHSAEWNINCFRLFNTTRWWLRININHFILGNKGLEEYFLGHHRSFCQISTIRVRWNSMEGCQEYDWQGVIHRTTFYAKVFLHLPFE